MWTVTEIESKPEPEMEKKKESLPKEVLKFYGAATIATAAAVAVLVLYAFPESTKRLAENIDKGNQTIGRITAQNEEFKKESKALREGFDRLKDEFSREQAALADIHSTEQKVNGEAVRLLQLLQSHNTNSGQVVAVLEAIGRNSQSAQLLTGLHNYDQAIETQARSINVLREAIDRVYSDAEFRAPDTGAWHRLLVDHYESFVKKDLARAVVPATQPSVTNANSK
jgi:uncharacterized protein YoxC